jgi:hypothetical protein
MNLNLYNYLKLLKVHGSFPYSNNDLLFEFVGLILFYYRKKLKKYYILYYFLK